MKSNYKIANSNDESLEERLGIMNNRITSLTNKLKLKTIEFKECDVKYSKLENNNQELREMIKSMEKQKQGNKSIQCFSRRSDISTQTDDNNANAYAKLLVKTNLLEKNLEENKEKLEKQINENTKIKTENKRFLDKSLEYKIEGRNNPEPNTHNHINEEKLSRQEIEMIIEKNVEKKLDKFEAIIKNVLEVKENATLVEGRVTKLVNDNKTYAESVSNKIQDCNKSIIKAANNNAKFVQ